MDRSNRRLGASAIAVAIALALASACTLFVDTNDLNRYVPADDSGVASDSSSAGDADGSVESDSSADGSGPEGCLARVGVPLENRPSVILCDAFDDPTVTTLEGGGWTKGTVSTRGGELVNDEAFTKPRSAIFESGKGGVKGRASSYRQFAFNANTDEVVLHLRVLLETGFDGEGFGIFFPSGTVYLAMFPAQGNVSVYTPGYLVGPSAGPVSIKKWTPLVLSAKRVNTDALSMTLRVGEGAAQLEATTEIALTKDLGSIVGIELGNSNDNTGATLHIDDVWVELRK